jgi:hypothetical protein
LLLIFPLFHRHTRSSDSISFSPSSPCSFYFLSSIPLVSCPLPFHPFCLQTLPLSFPLSLSAYSSLTLKYFSCTFPTSSCSFHLQISAPDINTLSIMLSNIIILLLKSPPNFLSPIPQTDSTLPSSSPSYKYCSLVLFSYLPSSTHSLHFFLFLLLNTIIFVFSTFTSSFFFLTYFPRLFIICCCNFNTSHLYYMITVLSVICKFSRTRKRK